MPVFEQAVAERIEKEILMAGKIKKKIGKGYEYPVKGSLIYLHESVTGKAHQHGNTWSVYKLNDKTNICKDSGINSFRKRMMDSVEGHLRPSVLNECKARI